jgi:predicted GIY-YIG superfamily endonuclease
MLALLFLFVYIFITTNLEHRMKQHKAEVLYTEKFAKKYDDAKREREIKGWCREKNDTDQEGIRVSLP